MFKNCAPCTCCKIKINIKQVDNIKDLDVMMPMLMEYNDNYSKTSGSSWPCYREKTNVTLTDYVII